MARSTEGLGKMIDAMGPPTPYRADLGLGDKH